jgi:hypothetical protein
MSLRPVKQILQTQPTIEGAGVKLQRAFGFGKTAEFDPFLLLDDFRNENPADYLAGFPWHPHRGIETITYVLAGEVAHGDSLGNKGRMTAGDVQWMTAGSGILHQEMPKGDERGRMHGFQLWANLPAAHKMTDPRYQDIPSSAIPEVTEDDGTKARIICGEFWGKRGPVEGVATESMSVDARYVDISVPPGKKKRIQVETTRNAFAYVFSGAGTFRDASNRALRPRRRDCRPGRAGRHPLPAGLGQAARRAGGVARADCHEHAGRAAPGNERAAERNIYQACVSKARHDRLADDRKRPLHVAGRRFTEAHLRDAADWATCPAEWLPEDRCV